MLLVVGVKLLGKKIDIDEYLVWKKALGKVNKIVSYRMVMDVSYVFVFF